MALFNNNENGQFGVKTPVDYHQPSAAPSNGIYATRWSDELANVHYTLNYVYGWTRLHDPVSEYRRFRHRDLGQ